MEGLGKNLDFLIKVSTTFTTSDLQKWDFGRDPGRELFSMVEEVPVRGKGLSS